MLEIRCEKCNKLLAKIADDGELKISKSAFDNRKGIDPVGEKHLSISIKCPRCGEMSEIKI